MLGSEDAVDLDINNLIMDFSALDPVRIRIRIRKPLMSRRRGNLFVTAATEYYKNRNILQEQVLTIAKISNKIKKGRNRHIYIFT